MIYASAPAGTSLKKSPPIASQRDCNPASAILARAFSAAWGMSKTIPCSFGFACRIPISNEPLPPPISTSLANGEKSYEAAIAAAVIGAKVAIASSKTFAISGFCAIAVKAVASGEFFRNAGSPVWTQYSSSFHESWMPTPANSCTEDRIEPGTTVRSNSANGVSANIPPSRSSNTPTLASKRITRLSDGACVLRRLGQVFIMTRAVFQEIGDAQLRRERERAREIMSDADSIERQAGRLRYRVRDFAFP